MAAVEQSFHSDDLDPIDLVESLAEFREWDFDRVADDQIAMAVEGQWRTYSISLAWSAQDETLRLICSFELNAPQERRAELTRALLGANERIWTGGFSHWPDDGVMVYRYALSLAGGATATAGQVDAMLRAAVGACERFYPAFQLVAWGGEAAEAGLEMAIAEAFGRA